MHLDGQLDLKGLDEMIKLQGRLGAIGRPITAAEISDLRFMPNVPTVMAAE